jgi:hypothetical protein
MANRGEQTKTPSNSRKRITMVPESEYPEPTAELNRIALKEYKRLCRVLDSHGMLERAEPGVITSASLTKERLVSLYKNLAFGLDPKYIDSKINAAENIYLGRLKALGLTLQPSRSVVKTTARQPVDSSDPWSNKAKIVG